MGAANQGFSIDGAPPARSAAGATELPSWGALAAATSRPQPRGKDSSHAGMTARITFHRDADGFTDAAVLKGGPKAKSKGKRKGKK